MGYISLPQFKHAHDVDDDDDDVNIQRAIDAASEAIDSRCGRRFSVDAADVTKHFYPATENALDVVDLVEVTSIKTDSRGDRSYSTTLATTDYELLPYNGERYQQIRMWPTSSKAFGPGRLVQIVGRFGYAEGVDLSLTPEALGYPPYPIQQACLILAGRLFKRREAPFGILSATDLGTYARLSADDPDVAALLNEYKLTRGRAWALV